MSRQVGPPLLYENVSALITHGKRQDRQRRVAQVLYDSQVSVKEMLFDRVNNDIGTTGPGYFH